MKKNLNNLYKKWRKKYPNEIFLADGPLSFEHWKKDEFKIAFLLKESYGGFESCDKYKEIAFKKIFWWNLARWNHIIRTKLTFGTVDKTTIDKTMPRTFESIAIIDVKKIDNSNSTSNNSIINKYAKNDKELLEEQIKIINPNIILCGATFSSYKIIFENSPEIKKISSKCFIHNDRLIINFEHVSARKKIDVLINKLDSILTSEVLDYCKTIIKSK